MSLLRFWVLNMVVVLLSLEGQKALGFHQKYVFNLCSEDKQRFYGSGMTRGWVINDNFHFWVNYPFNSNNKEFRC